MAAGPGCIAGLRAETPPSGTTTPEYGAGISPVQTKRMRHLAPRHRSQHTFFVNAGYTAVLSTLYFKESTSGSLNEGHDITAGYNWTSRRGFGVGVIYSADSSRPSATASNARRACTTSPRNSSPGAAGRRWLFRESAGIGYGRYVRGYGDVRGSRGGVGIHESASVEFMLTRHLGLSAGVSGQWLIVGSPDVGDGFELNLAGIFRIQFGGGVRFYF